MGRRDDGFWDEDTESSRTELDKLVLSRLVRDRQQTAEQLSDQLPETIPWDVLMSCRRLSWRGLAVEGQGNYLGHFKLP